MDQRASSGPGLRMFWGIAERWCLSPEGEQALLGVSASACETWRERALEQFELVSRETLGTPAAAT